MKIITMRIMYSAIGGASIYLGIHGILNVHLSWLLFILIGMFLIYESRWTHFDWMFPQKMYDL